MNGHLSFLSGPASSSSAQRRLGLAIGFVIVAVLVIYFTNRVFPCVNFAKNLWTCPQTVPVMSPIGNDFQVGLYEPAQQLRVGKSPYDVPNAYPPFVSVLALPFTLFKLHTAYLIHLFCLVAANAVSLCLATHIAVSMFANYWNRLTARMVGFALVIALAFTHFTSYPFEFSIERGNCDAYATLFGVLTLWLLVKRPTWLWLQVILTSLAFQLKLYPCILFFLIFWWHRWRAIMPIAALNAALFLCLGWAPLREYYRMVWLVGGTFPVNALYHSSGASFWITVMVPFFGFPQQLSYLATLLPIVLWCIAAVVLWRGRSKMNLALLYAVSVPVMNLVPRNSHDYKLVNLIASLAMILTDSVFTFAAQGSLWAAVNVVGLMLLAGGLSRSYMITETPWLAHKYPIVLLMQVLFLVAALAHWRALPCARVRGGPDARAR